jgi:hypothetical protein
MKAVKEEQAKQAVNQDPQTKMTNTIKDNRLQKLIYYITGKFNFLSFDLTLLIF